MKPTRLRIGIVLLFCLISSIAMGANSNGNGASLNLLTTDWWSSRSQNGANATLLSAGTPGTGVVSVNGRGVKAIIDPLNGLIGNTLPHADFAAAPVSGDSPLVVRFVDTSSGGLYTMTSCYWEFGDGHSSNEDNLVYVYDTPGTYSVTLTISTNGGGDATVTKTNLITVNEHGLPAIALPGLTALSAACGLIGVRKFKCSS